MERGLALLQVPVEHQAEKGRTIDKEQEADEEERETKSKETR